MQLFMPNGNPARRLVGTPIAQEKEGGLCLHCGRVYVQPNPKLRQMLKKKKNRERQRKTNKDRERQGKTENSEIQGHAMFTLWQGVCLAPP